MSEFLSGWVDSSLDSRVALTLVHFLWQGTLIAALVWVCAAMLRNASASARYLVFVGGLVGMALCAIVTLSVLQVGVQRDGVSLTQEASSVTNWRDKLRAHEVDSTTHPVRTVLAVGPKEDSSTDSPVSASKTTLSASEGLVGQLSTVERLS
jgi:hypothetical protein